MKFKASAFAIPLSIVLSGCGGTPDNDVIPEQAEGQEHILFDASAASPGLTVCTLSVHGTLECFEISLYWVGPPDAPPGFRRAHTLVISPMGEDTAMVFDGLDASYHESLDTQGYLVSEDMNFDGYTDFRLMEFPTAGPNTYWYFWLFNPDSGTFFRSAEYEGSNLVSPEFIQDEKMIRCFHRDGMGIYGTEYYTCDNDLLTLVRADRTEWSGPDSQVTTVTRLIDGEMVITELNMQVVD